MPSIRTDEQDDVAHETPANDSTRDAEEVPAAPEADASEETDPEHVWLPGQVVRVHGLSERAEFNGCTGRVLTVPESITAGAIADPNTTVPASLSGALDTGLLGVRVHTGGMLSEATLIAPSNLTFIADDDEARLSVMWTYTRRVNTGQRGGFAEVMIDAFVSEGEDDAAAREVSCTVSELHEFVHRMQFERVQTPALDALGMHVAAFSKRPVPGDQIAGRENVLASQLTMHVSDGRPATGIVGTAFFVRLDASRSDTEVNLTHEEFMRTCMFLNDLTPLYKDVGGAGVAHVWPTLAACFPFYEMGCKVQRDGFTGIKCMVRSPEGDFDRTPDDMQPAPSFVIQ